MEVDAWGLNCSQGVRGGEGRKEVWRGIEVSSDFLKQALPFRVTVFAYNRKPAASLKEC